jgi:hypothetical protein
MSSQRAAIMATQSRHGCTLGVDSGPLLRHDQTKGNEASLPMRVVRTHAADAGSVGVCFHAVWPKSRDAPLPQVVLRRNGGHVDADGVDGLRQ